MDTEGIVESAINSLGKGFDLTSDFRLKFCKGEERLIVLNETERRELMVPGFGAVRDVSVDIKCDKGDRTRYQSDILTFTQVSHFYFHRNYCHQLIMKIKKIEFFYHVIEIWFVGFDFFFFLMLDVRIVQSEKFNSWENPIWVLQCYVWV